MLSVFWNLGLVVSLLLNCSVGDKPLLRCQQFWNLPVGGCLFGGPMGSFLSWEGRLQYGYAVIIDPTLELRCA